MTVRTFLYFIGRLMGDVNAVKRGPVARRIGRRTAGKMWGTRLSQAYGNPLNCCVCIVSVIWLSLQRDSQDEDRSGDSTSLFG